MQQNYENLLTNAEVMSKNIFERGLFYRKLARKGSNYFPGTFYRISPCIICTFFTQKVVFKIPCVYYKRTQNFQVFSEAFLGAKTNDSCVWTSKMLHRSNTVRNCFLWILSKLQLMFFRLKIVVLFLVYFFNNVFGLRMFFFRFCVLDTERREVTLKPVW